MPGRGSPGYGEAATDDGFGGGGRSGGGGGRGGGGSPYGSPGGSLSRGGSSSSGGVRPISAGGLDPRYSAAPRAFPRHSVGGFRAMRCTPYNEEDIEGRDAFNEMPR